MCSNHTPKCVARTSALVCRKVFGMAMAYSPPVDDFTQQGRNEAAAKLSKNREVVRAGAGACTSFNLSMFGWYSPSTGCCTDVTWGFDIHRHVVTGMLFGACCKLCVGV